MKEAQLAQEIKSFAFEIGFAAVGITTPEPPLHLEVYFDWLDQGCHGEMGYMAQPRSVYLRNHPAELLPGCQSVIVLAARYPTPNSWPLSQEESGSHPLGGKGGGFQPRPLLKAERGSGYYSWVLSQAEQGGAPLSRTISSEKLGDEFSAPLGSGSRGEGLYGRVAAYAWSEDYHFVLRQRMEALVHRMHERVGRSIAYRCFTDSAPILERELAQRAGLGWIGKNTCLIHPRLGSYLFLAEIFTDLPLPPDKPFLPDRCGICQRCLQACPTQCILPNRTLDARRCISYLTIEHKSAIPVELRTSLGDWVFGCDICQQVCPWNWRVSPMPSFSEFLPQAERVWLSLDDMLSMTQLEFKQTFQNSPLLRPKWRGLVRNSTVVLGNLPRLDENLRSAAFELLKKSFSSHQDSLIRQHLVWSLIQLDPTLARQTLQEHVKRETNPLVKAELEALLRQSESY